MLRLIKNAIVYKAELPSAEHMTTHLAELPYGPLSEAQLGRSSFVPNSTTNELVTTFEGGFSFCLRLDEKILPAAIVRAKANERIAEAEAKMPRRLKKAEKDAIRAQVHLDLAKVALIKTTIVTAFYHQDSQFLVVATPSKRLASIMLSQLIKVVGVVKTRTIHISDIKHGLTTRLSTRLEGAVDNDPFGDFETGEFCELKKGDEKVSYQISSLDSAASGLSDAIADGFEVDRLQLTYKDVTFKLTSEFHFKAITFATELDREDAEQSDPVYIWRHEASVQLMQFAALVTAMCDLLGYQPPVDEA